MSAESSNISDPLLKQLVECPICYEYMREARILKCGHRMCSDCCKKIHEQEGFQAVVCGQCRARYSMEDVIKDFTLSQFVEKLNLQSEASEVEEAPVPEKVVVDHEPTHPCCSCSNDVPIKELFCCVRCPVDVNDFICCFCAVSRHRDHNIMNAFGAQEMSSKDVKLCKLNTHALKKLEDNAENRKVFMDTIISIVDSQGVKLEQEILEAFNVSHIEKVEDLKHRCGQVQELLDSFAKDTETRWIEICNSFVDNLIRFCELDHNTIEAIRASITNENLAFNHQVHSITSAQPENVFSIAPNYASSPIRSVGKKLLRRRNKQ